MRRYILLFISSMLIFGCSGYVTPKDNKTSSLGNMYVKAKVVQTEGDKAYLETSPLADNYDKDSPAAVLASKIINMTYLTEGSETKAFGKTLKILEKRGNTVVVAPASGFKAGDELSLYVPKKTLVMTDFNVKEGDNNVTGKLAFGDFAEKLTNSGQFVVLERKELSAVLQEHSLEMHGLTDSQQASLLGKLLKAELVLTGDMTRNGFKCVFDLRAIDSSTGTVLGVARESAMCSRVADTANIRSTSADLGNFETTETRGWIFGNTKKFSGRTVIDPTQGANGTSKSMKIMVDNFGGKNSGAMNKEKRDVSSFSTVTFYAKADRDIVGSFVLAAESENQSDGNDKWAANFMVGTVWQKYTLKLSEMVFSGNKNSDGKPGADWGKVFMPDMINMTGFMFPKHKNRDINTATVWIDEITFN